MAGIDDIIGGWVKDAEKSGEVKRLPGYGKPLNLDDDRHVPPKYRVAYRVLKNAGYAPPEVEMIQQVAELRKMLEAETDSNRSAELRSRLIGFQQKLDVMLNRSAT